VTADRRALLPALAAILSMLPVLVPAARGLVPGHPMSDLADHVQGAWWWGGEVLSGRVPWRVDGILWPDGGVLWYPDPIGAALALPFRWLGAPGAYTVSLALQCAANALAAAWLGRRIGGPDVAWMAACVVGPSAYVASLVHGGLAEYVGIWPIVLFAGGMLGWLGNGERPWLPAVAMGVATLQAAYYGAFCGLLGLCLAVGSVERLRRALPVLAVGAALSAPTLLAIRASLASPEAAVVRELAPGWVQPVPPGTDLLLWLWPADRYHPDTPALGNPGILHVHSLGWLALGLAVLGWTHPAARPFRWGAVCWLVLSLGPTLVADGWPLRIAGVDVPLPGRILWLPGSPFAFVHHPYRMVAATLPLLGVLAGLGALRLPAPARIVAGLAVVGEAWLLSPAPFPWEGTDATPPALYADLPDGAVLDLPADLRLPNRRYVLWHASHGRPVPYGVNTWLARSLREDPQVQDLLRTLGDVGRRTNRDVPPREPAWPGKRDHGGLGGLGIAAVVLHPDLAGDDADALRARLAAALGEPEARDGRYVWVVRGEP
jgi:hypothetical protein